MIFVLMSWIYISLLIFAPGYALSEAMKRICRTDSSFELPLPLILINGLFVSAITALYFGLFYKVGLGAHLFLMVLSGCCYFFFNKGIWTAFRRYRAGSRSQPWFIWVFFIVILLVQCYASYLPSSHNDDGLYFSTSIKWVQEYGTIPGLANINPRIGFNSSWLILQAIFGFPFLHAGLFNDMNGLLFLYVFLIFLSGLRRFCQGERSLFAFMRVFFFLPILFLNDSANTEWVFFNLNFFSSPSPDIPACLLTWLLLLLFVQPDQEQAGGTRLNQFLIMMYGGWLLTIKLSSVAVTLLMLYIIISWIRRRNWKTIAAICACLLLTIVPWCTRTLLLTGYPIFPLPVTDWFSFDWKMPLHHVQWHKQAVKVYAIDNSLDLSKPFQQSLTTWFPGWFERLPYIHAVLMLFIGAGTIGFFVLLLVRILRRGKSYLYQNRQWLTVTVCCIAGIAFWLLNGPDMRLGVGFCLFFVMLGISWVCRYLLQDYVPVAARILLAILAVLIFNSYGSFLNGIVNHLFVRPLTPRVATRILEERDMGHGVKLRLVDYTDSWNTPLPCAPLNEINALSPVLRGNTLRQGFRARQ